MKRQRLIELGFANPEWLRLAPVDFEAGASWWEKLATAGFDARKPAVVVSTGVSMYLTRDANAATLRHIASLALGSPMAMTFMLPLDLIEPEERLGRQPTKKFARLAWTAPSSASLCRPRCSHSRAKPGFREVEHVSAASFTQRYFGGRTDGLRPSIAEELLVART